MARSEKPGTNDHEPMAYRIADAVRVSGISKSTIYDLASKGRITLSKIRRRTLVPAAELRRLIEEGRMCISRTKRIDAAVSTSSEPKKND